MLMLGSAIAMHGQGVSVARLLYQGHGSIRLVTANGLVIYIDPYAGKGYDLPADYVFITHEHPDHNVVSLVPQKPGCRVFHAKNFFSGGRYGTAVLNGVRIQAVPAYNKNHKQTECVGYVFTLENGIKVYCAGDTSYTNYMEANLSKMHIDYALLPCDGVYNMDAKEAAHCADLIGAHYSIPIHTNPGALFDSSVAERFAPLYSLRLILKPSQEIFLEKLQP